MALRQVLPVVILDAIQKNLKFEHLTINATITLIYDENKETVVFEQTVHTQSIKSTVVHQNTDENICLPLDDNQQIDDASASQSSTEKEHAMSVDDIETTKTTRRSRSTEGSKQTKDRSPSPDLKITAVEKNTKKRKRSHNNDVIMLQEGPPRRSPVASVFSKNIYRNNSPRHVQNAAYNAGQMSYHPRQNVQRLPQYSPRAPVLMQTGRMPSFSNPRFLQSPINRRPTLNRVRQRLLMGNQAVHKKMNENIQAPFPIQETISNNETVLNRTTISNSETILNRPTTISLSRDKEINSENRVSSPLASPISRPLQEEDFLANLDSSYNDHDTQTKYLVITPSAKNPGPDETTNNIILGEASPNKSEIKFLNVNQSPSSTTVSTPPPVFQDESVETSEKYPCRACGQSFISQEMLNNHKFSCENTLTNSSLTDSTKFDSTDDNKCQLCGQIFINRQEMTNHMITDHDNESITSPDKQFRNSNYLCKICKKTFQYATSYHNHCKNLH